MELILTGIGIGYAIYLAAAYFGYIPPSHYNITHKPEGFQVDAVTPLSLFYVKMHDGYFETVGEALSYTETL